MAADPITVHLPVGAVAALLTAFEFVLTILLGMSIRGLFRASYLMRLHTSRRLPLSSSSRSRRALYRSLVSSFLAIWLVVSVAVVESNLARSIHIHDSIRTDLPNCVRTDVPADPTLLTKLTPDLRVVIEGWTLAVAKACPCVALAALGSGGGGALERNARTAPACTSGLKTQETRIQLEELSVLKDKFEMVPARTNLYEILPYDFDTSNTRRNSDTCTRKGISDVYTTIERAAAWKGLYTDSDAVSKDVHRRLCELHPIQNNNNNNNIDPHDVSKCISNDDDNNNDKNLNVSCVPRTGVYTATLTNMTAFFSGTNINTPAIACYEATIRVAYTFIKTDPQSQHADLLPLSMTAVNDSGFSFCEHSVNVVARSALVYTADSEWRRTEITEILTGRRRRFHAFSVATASAQFPLASLLNTETEQKKRNCSLRNISDSTNIVVDDWGFVLFITAVVISAIAMATALTYRVVVYGKESWNVGTAQWALQKLNTAQQQQEGRCEEESGLSVVVVERRRNSVENLGKMMSSTTGGGEENEREYCGREDDNDFDYDDGNGSSVNVFEEAEEMEQGGRRIRRRATGRVEGRYLYRLLVRNLNNHSQNSNSNNINSNNTNNSMGNGN